MPSEPRRIPLLVLLAGLVLSPAACSKDASSTVAPTPTNPLPSLTVMLSEKTMGSASAPVTMVEYSSLSCPHCADFHINTLPLIKSTYVDTGKVQFIFRDFPLNDAAMGGAMVARCAGDRYFDVIGRLFTYQASWASSSDWKGSLKTVVLPLGITSNDVEACLAQQDLQNGITNMKQTGATTYAVSATPTFLINSQRIVGALSYADFDAAIKSALGQ